MSSDRLAGERRGTTDFRQTAINDCPPLAATRNEGRGALGSACIGRLATTASGHRRAQERTLPASLTGSIIETKGLNGKMNIATNSRALHIGQNERADSRSEAISLGIRAFEHVNAEQASDRGITPGQQRNEA